MNKKIGVFGMMMLGLLMGCEPESNLTGPVYWHYEPCLANNTERFDNESDDGYTTITEYRATLTEGLEPSQPIAQVCDTDEGCVSLEVLIDEEGNYYHTCGTRVLLFDENDTLVESHNDFSIVLFYNPS